MKQTVTTAPRTSTFQFRINPKIRERAESIYAGCGLTLTDAINIFIQHMYALSLVLRHAALEMPLGICGDHPGVHKSDALPHPQ